VNHLAIEQLERYSERQMNAEEITQTLLHLDGCRACFDAFQRTLSELSPTLPEISFDALTGNDPEVFHLDYAEHLRPYVDFETDEVRREIVASHLQNCSFCARAVRELREFSDSLKLRTVEQEKKSADLLFAPPSNYPPPHFYNGNLRYWFLPAAAVLISLIGGNLVWRQSDTTPLIAETRISRAVPKTAVNENSVERLLESKSAKTVIKTQSVPTLRRNDNSFKEKSSAVGGQLPAAVQPKGDEKLLAALPPNFRAQFETALRMQKIEMPLFIAELREESNLRGDSAAVKDVILSPSAQDERNSRPVFKWRKFSDGTDHYLVTIYDQDFKQIAASPRLQNLKWQSSVSLERGKIYNWQVKTANSGNSYSARFKLLDVSAVVRLKAIENAVPHSVLAYGIAYASEGLLIEADQMFQKALKKIRAERQRES